jgi:hypothetical protein
MPGQYSHASARLPVPDPDRLVIAGTHDPRVLVVELHGTDVVEVASKREQAAVRLVIPHLDLVIVTCIASRKQKS